MLRKWYRLKKGDLVVLSRLFAPIIMRFSFSFIFIWFGLLKIIGVSPIEELVRKTSFLVNEHLFVILLGYFEVAIGICFLFKKLYRLGIILFFLQVPGTFIPLFTNRQDCFSIFPYALTLEGQYIFKNFFLIAGALYVFSTLERKR